MQKWIFLTVLLTSLTACSAPKVRQPSAEILSQNATYEIVNLGKEFQLFWAQAKSKPFKEQLSLWNEVVEKPHQDLFDSLVNSKNQSKGWEEKKEKRLKQYFSELPQKYDAEKKAFDSFNKTLNEQIRKYSIRFPDSKFTNKIYAVPGANFNGKVGQLKQSEETVLAFGINVILEIEDDPDVLYSHELFHIYHVEKLKNSSEYSKKAMLTLPLWMEGLSVFVSKEMNPNKGDDKIFMSSELASVSEKDVRWLAKEFLKIADTNLEDTSKAEHYQNWFVYGKKVRNDLPTRAGYLLGYRVVKILAKQHTTYEMSGWNLDKIHQQVKAALQALPTESSL